MAALINKVRLRAGAVTVISNLATKANIVRPRWCELGSLILVHIVVKVIFRTMNIHKVIDLIINGIKLVLYLIHGLLNLLLRAIRLRVDNLG